MLGLTDGKYMNENARQAEEAVSYGYTRTAYRLTKEIVSKLSLDECLVENEGGKAPGRRERTKQR